MSGRQTYYRPNGLMEAVALLKRSAPRAVIVAGGTSISEQSLRNVEAVVDISGLGLTRISFEGSCLRIGASVTHQTLVEHERLGVRSSEALRIIGLGAAETSSDVRGRATVAGALVTADAASPLVTVLLACDADVVIAGAEDKTQAHPDPTHGFRVLPLAGFLAYRRKLLDTGVLITEVRLPLPSADTRGSYLRLPEEGAGFPLACAAASFAMRDGIVGNMRLALGGVAALPIRLTRFEKGVEKKRLADWLDSELSAALALLPPLAGEQPAQTQQRHRLAEQLARQALQACLVQMQAME
ncbi:MAG: FAD binding domain-containing protein [Thermoflexales bacterium]